MGSESILVRIKTMYIDQTVSCVQAPAMIRQVFNKLIDTPAEVPNLQKDLSISCEFLSALYK